MPNHDADLGEDPTRRETGNATHQTGDRSAEAARHGGRRRPGGLGDLGAHRVGRIGYGTLGLERLRSDPDAAVAVVRRAVELGIDHIDTAEFYGDGFANEVLRRALGPDDDVVIVSKVGATSDPDGPIPLRAAQRPVELRAEVENNLRTLGRESIPVINLRRLDVGPGIVATGDQIVDVDDQLAELISLREQGKIGAIGLSGVGSAVLRRALPAGIVCVQNGYNILAREYEPLLELCLREQIAWVPFFPLGAGRSGFTLVTEHPTIQQVARSLGRTPAEVALGWLLGHAPNTLLIPGTASIDHLEDNVAAGDLDLDAETTAILDRIGAESATRGEQPPRWPADAR